MMWEIWTHEQLSKLLSLGRRVRWGYPMRVSSFSAGDNQWAAVAHIDITELKESEQQTHLFGRIIETGGQAIFITDRDGEITYINPAFEKVTGYSAEEALGQTPRLLKSSEHNDSYYDELWPTILSGNSGKEK